MYTDVSCTEDDLISALKSNERLTSLNIASGQHNLISGFNHLYVVSFGRKNYSTNVSFKSNEPQYPSAPKFFHCLTRFKYHSLTINEQPEVIPTENNLKLKRVKQEWETLCENIQKTIKETSTEDPVTMLLNQIHPKFKQMNREQQLQFLKKLKQDIK